MDIQEVRFSPSTIEKIEICHGLTQTEVEDAIFSGTPFDSRWSEDEKHGIRLMVTSRTHDDKEIFIALRPLDSNGTYECITAFLPSRQGYYHDQR